ncbi:allantoinase AllB [Kyrpidia spormannii]|uniref:Allantoinase n=1 Tax=Kyrpidia spormannii TaxID=2055160 RepID=A0ACA8Z9H4_9BACL|nr:allantoinase AllB [Kyrpidia spormannii]CAB3392770.1 Allantoinase [Kyrpidia spormannii]
MFDLILRGGQIVTPRETYRGDIGVVDGKIAAVGMLEGAEAGRVYDATGRFVLPGLIDEHVHSRDPGLTHKEDFAHSTRAAAAGGITTILEMPNCVPPVRDADHFYRRVEEIAPKAHVDYGLYGIVLGDENLEALPGLAEAGVIGFKLFWGYALDRRSLALVYDAAEGGDIVPPPDEGQIFEAFRVIGEMGRAVAVHAENRELIARLTRKERAAGGADYAAFLRSRPAVNERLTTEAAMALGQAAGVHVHILHMTSADGVEALAEARRRGWSVTGETCPHYLTLTDEDWERVGVRMKILPPIRQRDHQKRLWEALRSGELQAVGSDHSPHTEEEKRGDIWSAPAGFLGVQTLVPLMLDAVVRGKLSLNRLVELMAENPARIWGFYGVKGVIRPGADADFTVVDLDRTWVVRGEDLYSKSRVQPYEGRSGRGAPVAAFVRGVQVMEDGRPIAGPVGRLVKPGV